MWRRSCGGRPPNSALSWSRASGRREARGPRLMPRDIALLDGPAEAALPRRRNYARRYVWFVVPAAAVIVAVILFPWLFTLYVSAFDWHLGSERRWVGLENYARLFTDAR